jgi:hypothetical protein
MFYTRWSAPELSGNFQVPVVWFNELQVAMNCVRSIVGFLSQKLGLGYLVETLMGGR